MFEGEVAHGLMERMRLSRWLRRFPPRLVWASFVFINGFVAVAILSGLALISHTPLVFPSAGATTLIISLGFITAPAHLGVMEIAVALMAIHAFVINRLAGIDYPLWGRGSG